MTERRRRPMWLVRIERQGGRAGVVLVLLSVLLFGAAHEQTLLGLSLASALAAGLLAGGRLASGRGVRVGWPALGLGALSAYLLLQLVPLPPSVLGLLSPVAHELYVAAHQPLGLYPAWRPLSLDPPATLLDAARVAGLACLFVLLDHRARSSDRGRRELLLWPALLIAVLAVLALALHMAGQTSLLGLWSTFGTSTPLVSPFRNPNHFAGALNVATFLLLGLAATTAVDDKWPRRLLVFGALACVGAQLFNLSVGGLAALGAGLLVFTGLSLRLRRPEGAAGLPFVGAAVAVIVVVLAAMPELGPWAQSSEAGREGKLQPVEAAVAIAKDFPLFGAGRGAFRTLHDRYLSKAAGVTYTHVENEPLQAIAELGWLVGGLSVLLVVLAVLGLVRRAGSSLLEAGAAAGAIALLLQNLVDFSLHYSGAYLLVALVAMGATGRDQKESSAIRVRLRGIGTRGAVAVCSLALVTALLALRFASSSLEAEEAALANAAGNPAVTVASVESAAVTLLERRPADYLAAQAVVRRVLSERGAPGKQARWIGTLLELAPQSGHSHLLAGEALSRIGAREQALLEWRQAAELRVPSVDHVLRRYPDRESVLASAPSGPLAAVEASRRLVAAGHADWALAVAESARQAPHRELDALLSDLLSGAGHHERALEMARALRSNAMEWNYAWRAEALALKALGRVDEAGALLSEGFQQIAGDYMLGVLLASHFLGAGQLDDALSTVAAIDAKDRGPVRADVARLRSVVYERMGKLPLALGEMRTAVSLDPVRGDLRVRLARLCLDADLVEEAWRALSLADPSQPEVVALSREIVRRQKPRHPSASELETLLGSER